MTFVVRHFSLNFSFLYIYDFSLSYIYSINLLHCITCSKAVSFGDREIVVTLLTIN